MPQNKHALIRYHIIDCLLRQYDYVKTSQIVISCEKKTGYRVSQRTIQMDIEAMKYDSFLRFFAPIEYSNHRKAYYYSHQDYKLINFHFSKNEIQLFELVISIAQDTLKQSEREILESMIIRMKIFTAACD